MVLERRKSRKEVGENPDWGKGAGSQRDAQRWKLGDAQGLSPATVQKGHCGRMELAELPAQIFPNSTDFSARVEIKG